LGTNRNKRSISCDIANPSGQDLIRSLALNSHVFIENFKVGDMARYGLDYASLKAINPRLVYCSITGFGQTGPYSERAGYDFAIQAMGGLMSVTGERDAVGGGPQKVGVAVADLFTGMYATVAILAAIRHAERTGVGQYIDMALLDTQVAMLANLGANYLVNGAKLPPPQRMGNAHVNIVPYQVFEVAPKVSGERDFMIVAVGNDGQYAKFCDVAGHPELATDLRFAKNTDRVKNRQVLVPLLEEIMLKRTKADWLSALEAAKVPCGAINNLSEVFADPHVTARQMVSTWQHPNQKDLKLILFMNLLQDTHTLQRLNMVELQLNLVKEALQNLLLLQPAQNQKMLKRLITKKVSNQELKVDRAENISRANTRDFRDSVTRAKGAVDGIPTEAIQWNRWNV
jgi:crotonobetainyl-CoA:carnitine CoA-transferase CaiB-like acyl-CoA transferase